MVTTLLMPPTHTQTLLHVDHVSRDYRLGETVIRAVNDLSLEIATGEFLALLGSSGSGKSTLLNLMAGLDRPTSGSIQVPGKSLPHYNAPPANGTGRNRATPPPTRANRRRGAQPPGRTGPRPRPPGRPPRPSTQRTIRRRATTRRPGPRSRKSAGHPLRRRTHRK